MSREWKPGDVAVSLAHGYRSIFVQHGRAGDACWHNASGLSDPADSPRRPLVVIDPEDREAVERLWIVLRDGPALRSRDNLAAALREFANPAPPPMDEPDTWGVVVASCVHADTRRHWMRHEDGNWYVVGTDNKNTPDDWDSLVDPTLVREGVRP